MKASAQAQERREIMAVARRYRRDGYKVGGPDDWTDKPGFLGDVMPDLIAERGDDHVVIAVKRAPAVRGSNQLVELAERVASQPGWRFELIAIRATTNVAKPDLTWGGENIRRLLDQSFPKPAFVLACAIIENLAAYASILQNRNPGNLAFSALVRDLVVHGVIGEDAMHTIDEALARRNAILFGASEPAPTRGEVEVLMQLGFAMERDISQAAA